MACTKNPILDYIDILIADYNTSARDFLDIITDHPFGQLGTNVDYCCPDCGGMSYVGLAIDVNGDSCLTTLYSTAGGSFPLSCCENYDLNDIGLFVSSSMIGTSKSINSAACCNSFSTCSHVFNDLMQKHVFADPLTLDVNRAGVQEYNTYSGDSLLCAINTKIQSLPDAGKISFLKCLYNSQGGFVAYCQGSDVYAGTLEGFRFWW